MDKVSIIIPVYNSEKTIIETLDSLRAQSYTNWEAICVDDGSTDNGIDIIQQYSSKDERIIYTKRKSEPKGGSACRNIGARLAKGIFLIFLDSDDILAPWCLENRLKAIVQTNYDFIVFPIGYFEKTVRQYSTTNNLYSKNHLLRFASGSPTWQTMQPIYRKSLFDKLGGFDARFPRYQDVEFGIRAILESKYYIVKDVAPDCFLRMFGNSGLITTAKAKKSILATTYLLELLSSLSQQTDRYDFDIAFLGLYAHLISFRYKAGISTPIAKDKGIPINKFIDKNLHGFTKYICHVIGNMNPSLFSRSILKILSKCIDIILDKNLLLYRNENSVG